jgi:hypothetical protein
VRVLLPHAIQQVFSLKVYLIPLILYSYPMSSGVPPKGCGMALRVVETEEGGGIEDEALELCISSILISEADDKLDGAIAVGSKGLVRCYAHFATFPVVRANHVPLGRANRAALPGPTSIALPALPTQGRPKKEALSARPVGPAGPARPVDTTEHVSTECVPNEK